MNFGPFIFLGVFFSLALSWMGMVLIPQSSLGRQGLVEVKESSELYPIARQGIAAQGAQVYRANGCYTCHSQQVRPEGSIVDVVVEKSGTNVNAVAEMLQRFKPGLSAPEAVRLVAEAPKSVLWNLDVRSAEAAASALRIGGAKVEVRLTVLGADLDRGWGKRRSVAQDYLHDYPVMAGSQRIGPDLANIGARQASEEWHLLHLYNPQITMPAGAKSLMPPYPYLFEKRKIGRQPSADALKLTGKFAPEAGYEVVPRHEARALAAYLLSLKADVALFEAPMPKSLTNTPINLSTNTPAAPSIKAPAT